MSPVTLDREVRSPRPARLLRNRRPSPPNRPVVTDPVSTDTGAPKPRSTRSFDYLAIDGRGQRVTGQLTAATPDEIVERLRRQQLRPVRIRTTSSSFFSRELSIPGLSDRVKPRELAAFTRQFSTMVSAGIPLTRTLAVLGEKGTNASLDKTLQQVRFDVESGDSLSKAISRHPRTFDQLYCSMVAAGEESGALDQVLLQLAVSQERAVAVRHKVRSAMAYPVAVLGLVLVVILIMLRFVVPRFSTIYDDLGGTLPLPTRALIAGSDLLVNRAPLLVAGVVLASLGIRRWSRTPEGRHRWHAAKLRLPLVGGLIHKTVLARFGRTMAVLTTAGVPVLDTFAITSRTVGNEAMRRALDRARYGVRRGEAIGASLRAEPLFPSTIVQLISVGEESGSLDGMLSIIGDSLEEEVATSIDGFSSLIEPLLMALIGVVVGGMVLALYLPMFRIIDFVQ